MRPKGRVTVGATFRICGSLGGLRLFVGQRLRASGNVAAGHSSGAPQYALRAPKR